MGLSLSGILVLSGAALVFASGTPNFQNVGNNLGTQSSLANVTLSTGIASSTPYGYGANGMMGGYGGNNGYGSNNGYGGNGYGMMGGYGSNGSYGMMGGGFDASSLGINLPNNQVSTAEQAIAVAKAYVQKLDSGLAVDELHEFNDSYEAELIDSKTGAKAYEFMIAKNGGEIYAEIGPNIMWNTKYGHMNWGNTGALTVSVDQANQAAQNFVAQMGQGYSLEKPENAPGYYEFMILKDGKDYAELDVNGYTGQVWFENWHGPIIKTIESK